VAVVAAVVPAAARDKPTSATQRPGSLDPGLCFCLKFSENVSMYLT